MRNEKLSPAEAKIIDYIKTHGSITALQAALDLRCMSLPQRIFDLRKKGWIIPGETKHYKDESGENVHYVRYTLA